MVSALLRGAVETTRLGAPVSVECLRKDAKSLFTLPDDIVLKYEFEARKSMPPVTVYWYDNVQDDAYTPAGMTVEQMRAIPDTGPQIAAPPGPGRGEFGRGRAGAAGAPGEVGRGRGRGGQGPQGSGYNCVFVGSKGFLGTRGRGEGVGLIPGSRWAEFTLPPQMLTRSPGHQRDWIRACKGGEAACSNFGIAGPYSEWMLLGMVATRVPGKLLWDPAKAEFTNSRDANKYVRPVFRRGWELRPLSS